MAIHGFWIAASLRLLSMNTPVIANEVKQSMTSNCLDCRAGRHCEERSDAAIAVTQKNRHCEERSDAASRVRYLTGYGGLAMTIFQDSW